MKRKVIKKQLFYSQIRYSGIPPKKYFLEKNNTVK